MKTGKTRQTNSCSNITSNKNTTRIIDSSQVKYLRQANNHQKQLESINKQLKKKLSSIKSVYKNSYTYQYKQNSKKKYQIIPVAQDYEKMYERKESQLNTKFNVRKNKLMNITKINRKIHERINSQQSCYSARDYNASYEVHKSRCESISRSRSRLANGVHESRYSSTSSKNSSRISKNNKNNIRQKVKSKSNTNIRLNSLSINQLEKADQFRKMFLREKNISSDIKEQNRKHVQIRIQKKQVTGSICEDCIEEEKGESPLKPKKCIPKPKEKQNNKYPPKSRPINQTSKNSVKRDESHLSHLRNENKFPVLGINGWQFEQNTNRLDQRERNNKIIQKNFQKKIGKIVPNYFK